MRAAVTERTKCIFVESLANPGRIIMDVEAMAEVVHSLTKFMGRHGNALGGAVVESGRFDWAVSGRFPTIT